ncbi:MAG: hypothetical protein ACKO35_06220, partial [Planctomycetaceae bacterium]
TATVVAVAATAPTRPDAETVPVPITPQKYGDVATSGLTFDLKPGENTIDIDLVSSRDRAGPP